MNETIELSASAVIAGQFTYTLITCAMTVVVARSLARNGRVFLIDAFQGNSDLADAINQLLVVGFYLINLGWVLLKLQAYSQAAGTPQLIDAYAHSAGSVFIVLGIMHFFNIWLFSRYRRSALMRRAFEHVPPVQPSQQINVGPSAAGQP